MMADGGVWLTFLTIGASVAGTLGVTYFGSRLALRTQTTLKKEERDLQAAYLAVRIATVLEPFVIACVGVITDSGVRDADGCKHPEARDPTLVFPDDIDWRSIDPGLAYRILSLPNGIADAKSSVDYVGQEIATPPDHEEWFMERSYQFGKLGLAAHELTAELRDEFSLPKLNDTPYDPRHILKSAVSGREEMLKRFVATSRRTAIEINKRKAAKTSPKTQT